MSSRGAALFAALKKKKEEERTSSGGSGDPSGPSSSSSGSSPDFISTPTNGMGRAALIQLLKSKQTPKVSTSAASAGRPAVSKATPIRDTPLATPSATPSATPADATPLQGLGRAAIISKLRMSAQMPLPEQMKNVKLSEPKSEQRSDTRDREDTRDKRITSSGPAVTGRGKEGRKIPLSSNYLQLSVEAGRGVFEYEVTFDPVLDAQSTRFKCLGQHRDILGSGRVFDGSVLFLPYRLPQQETYLSSILDTTGETVCVCIKYKKQLHFGEQQCLHLYNILFRRIMKTLKFKQIQRHHFNPDRQSAILIPQHKLEIWQGYITGVDEYEGGLQLHCDASHKVLRDETALEVIKDHIRQNRSNRAEALASAKRDLLGEIVMTKYNNKTYRIEDIDMTASPKNTFFDRRTGTDVAYIDYYYRQYGLRIVDEDQPLLITRGRRPAPNEPEPMIHLIPELCHLTGISQKMRNDHRAMKDIARCTKMTPGQRVQSIRKFVESVYSNEEAHSHLKNWGLELSKETIRLEGRQLEPEKLYFGRRVEVPVPPNGDWDHVIRRNVPVLTAVNIEKWLLVFPRKGAGDVARRLFDEMRATGIKLGMDIARPEVRELPNENVGTYLEAIRRSLDPNVKLVVTIVNQKRSDRYTAIKKLCCLESPVANQVICTKTLSHHGKFKAIVSKIVLQINCKLGGELWATRAMWNNTMVVGVDVYHDPGKAKSSVAGIVASMNDVFSRYHSVTAKQSIHHVELLDAIKAKFAGLLMKYKEVNGRLPSRIVIFRDGVGDGRFRYVQEYEIPQIESTIRCAVEGDGYRPDIGFIVVSKRINTRIFFANKHAHGPNAYDNMENPPPGTVVDHTITRRNWFDFFLVSQKVAEGTVTPTHFVVLKNGGMNPDECQRLAYKLTHMYYNWPGTIRVPAPCQYAHKLAELVGQHLQREPNARLEERLFYL